MYLGLYLNVLYLNVLGPIPKCTIPKCTTWAYTVVYLSLQQSDDKTLSFTIPKCTLCTKLLFLLPTLVGIRGDAIRCQRILVSCFTCIFYNIFGD